VKQTLIFATLVWLALAAVLVVLMWGVGLIQL